jgi:hypothetical protein
MEQPVRKKCDWGPRCTRDVRQPQLLTGGGIYMQLEWWQPPETPNAPHRTAPINARDGAEQDKGHHR